MAARAQKASTTLVDEIFPDLNSSTRTEAVRSVMSTCSDDRIPQVLGIDRTSLGSWL